MMEEAIKEVITCSVCHDIYTQPVTVHCGHTFCKECIEQWIIKQGVWSCPLCMDTSSLDATMLNVNIQLRELSLNYTKSSEGETASRKCKHHPTKDVEYICVSCSEVICGKCSVIDKKHMDELHQVVEIDEGIQLLRSKYDQIKKRLHVMIEYLTNCISFVEDKRKDCTNASENIQQKSVELKEFMCKCVDVAMSKYFQPVINDLEKCTTHTNKLEHLKSVAMELETEVVVNVTLDHAESLSILQTRTDELKTSLKEYANEFNTMTLKKASIPMLVTQDNDIFKQTELVSRCIRRPLESGIRRTTSKDNGRPVLPDFW